MEKKVPRIPIVLLSEERKQRWKDFQISQGYSSESSMVRRIVDDFIENINQPIDKSMQPLIDSIEGLSKLTVENNNCLEIIKSKLTDQVGNSDVKKAAKELLQYAAQNGDIESISMIYGKFNYKSEIIDAAFYLLIDLGLFGTSLISSN